MHLTSRNTDRSRIFQCCRNYVERLVAKQLLDYLSICWLLPDLQSAYRGYHWTETAVQKVLSDILLVVNSGDLAVLALLDLSAECMSECLAHVITWMRSNRLQLNTTKSEVIWCSSTRRQHQIPQSLLVVGSDAVVPVRVVRCQGQSFLASLCPKFWNSCFHYLMT